MNKIVPIILLACLSGSVLAQSNNLDDLLKEVKLARHLSDKSNQQREQQFRQQRDDRKKILEQVQTELEQEKKRSEQLKNSLQENDKHLLELDEKIRLNSANLGELFGVVRQISGEAHASFKNSIISIQFPLRGEFLKRLSDSQSLPSIQDLNQLWYEMQRQMTQSGKTTQFNHTIITADGNEEERVITQVGEFNSLSNGKYLHYLGKTNQLVELERQPPQPFLSMAKQLEKLQQGEVPLAVDPSKGTLLSLLTQMPDLEERIHQGGVIGYIILAIGALSLIVALERYVYLSLIGFKIQRQKKSSKASLSNPLGRIMSIYHHWSQNRAQKNRIEEGSETLTLKLDEAILSETPKLEQRLIILGLFATVAPLLGLLGTVMGMIETFQSIALFGTGDPRLMSGGISQALVTTGLGLIVAVPVVLLHGYLQSKSNRLVQILDEESAGYIARYAEYQETVKNSHVE